MEAALRLAIEKVLCALALAPAVLVIVAVGLLIRRESPGPVLFRQSRVGRDGQAFEFLKLRTMHVDGDRILRRHLEGDTAAAAEWSRYRRLAHDPRIAGSVARFARRYSIDELPQIWNVLRGDMHLVGPRPMPTDWLSQLDAQQVHLRHTVRPGLTGLWQVSGRSELSVRSMVRLDLLYLKRRSLSLDAIILLKTIFEVLKARGAY